MNQWRLSALLAVAAAGLMSVPSGLAARAASTPMAAASGPGRPVTPIAQELRRTMDKLQFQQVLDLAPPGSAASKALPTGVNKNVVTSQQRARIYATKASAAQPIVQQPQIDATVLELDKAGRIISSGTVLMSPQYPHGIVVPVDQDFHTTDVCWRQWDDAGWYTNHAQGTIDVVPGRETAPIDFMLPYPASVLKLMVNFGVLRLVDSGEISLDDVYNYQPTQVSSLCGPASSNTVGGYIDASLTWSSNGAPGTLWTAPGGTPVTSAILSPSARRLVRHELGQQGWNWMLSTPNYCGAGYPAPGIPQVIAQRWIAPDGTVTVDGNYFGQDVQPCNHTAHVTFAHKPGWVSNSGADAGIVTSLPGRADRHYITAVFSNLGDQYQDPNRPPTPPGVAPVEYTQKFAQLGLAIDTYEAARSG
jgi:hypothetical protein